MSLPSHRLLACATTLLVLGALGVACSGGSNGDGTADRSGPDSTAATSVTDDGTTFDRVPEGVWAGDQLVLTVTGEGAVAEFDCAAGEIEKPLILDPSGVFAVEGSYASESGGPASTDDARDPPTPARYTGRLVDSRHLTLDVELTTSGATYGPFALELGATPHLERCV